jgi:DNA-binding beta-propeller fold protein YncE
MSSDTVSIIDLANDNQVVNVRVGEAPGAICVCNGKVVVANLSSGSVSILSEVSARSNFAWEGAEVKLSYPNPFNPECYIPVGERENEGGGIKVKIYNILGQLVKEIEISNLNQISKSVYWDGRESGGLEVPTGVYFYEVAGKEVRKMVVLK